MLDIVKINDFFVIVKEQIAVSNILRRQFPNMAQNSR